MKQQNGFIDPVIAAGAIGAVVVLGLIFIGGPQYNVWQQSLSGKAELQKADEDIIASVRSLIVEGINKKMALAKEVALDSQVSQKTAIGILERYNGKILHWSYSVGSKGANIYSLT